MSEDEDFVLEEESENPGLAVKKLRERLSKAIEEKQQYLEGWQRSRADFANFKREEEQRRSYDGARLRAELAEELLPALDAFDMALKDPSYTDAPANWKHGIESVRKELDRAMSTLGITPFAPLNEPFDPHRHEAVRQVETDDAKKDHTVASVERTGYAIGDHVIRPAQVTVRTYIA